MRTIDTTAAASPRALTALLDRRPGRDPLVRRRVAAIVDRVRRDGDRALISYARRFDGLRAPLEVTRDEMERAARDLTRDVRDAIAFAARRVRRVAARQKPATWTIAPTPGVTIRQRVLPLDRVGCYVPGGRYPLPSSLLMTAIPAAVAGVPEIIAVCPFGCLTR